MALPCHRLSDYWNSEQIPSSSSETPYSVPSAYGCVYPSPNLPDPLWVIKKTVLALSYHHKARIHHSTNVQVINRN